MYPILGASDSYLPASNDQVFNYLCYSPPEPSKPPEPEVVTSHTLILLRDINGLL